MPTLGVPRTARNAGPWNSVVSSYGPSSGARFAGTGQSPANGGTASTDGPATLAR
jgi:hypothetical protein